MREILFRAKRIDYDKFPKEEWWIEGNAFVHDDGRTVDISTGTEKFSINKRVIPETLCQYTGLTDKNGEKVFIGDVVRCTKGCPHEVIWLKEYAGTFIGGMPAIYLSGLREGYAWTGKEEKIGNIFDNPELLRGEY